MEGAAGSIPWGSVASWAAKAKKAVVEQAQAATSPDDLESGDGFGANSGVGGFASWAKGAADLAKKNLDLAAEKASATDWGEHAKAWQGDLISTLGKVSDNASKAGAGFSEGAFAAQKSAAMLAGNAKDRFEKAGSGLGSSFSGMSTMVMSPGKLLQFGSIFMVGFMLISLSMSFLPLLPIRPQKFALLFALGSMTMLGSVAQLKGPQAFASIAVQRDKLPWSGAYIIGLFGTLWATLIARSYLYTGLFAFMQAVGLLYFMASFIPGGKAVLNWFGRCTGRAASALVRSS